MKEKVLNVWHDPIIRRPLFLISAILFVIHQVLEKLFEIHIIWADNYLDMLVLMPILLTGYTIEKKYFNRSREKEVTNLEIVVLTIIVGFISEWLFPYLSPRFTIDAKDFLFLWFGSAAFYLERLVVNKSTVE